MKFYTNLLSSLAVSFFLWILLPTSYGQSLPIDLPPALQGGVKAGFVGAKIVGGVNTYFAPRWMLGAWAIYPSPFLEEMDFRVDLLLSSQGGRDASRQEVKGRWNYTYLNLPLLASFTPFETDKLRAEAGLQPGFLLRARYKDQGQKAVLGPETRNFDLSFVLGGTYHFKEIWMVDLRITLALFNHSKRDWTEDRYLNQTVQIGVGRKFVGP